MNYGQRISNSCGIKYINSISKGGWQHYKLVYVPSPKLCFLRKYSINALICDRLQGQKYINFKVDLDLGKKIYLPSRVIMKML